MDIPRGYAGSVTVIDLTEQKAQIQPTDIFFREYGIDPRLWLGGDGVITKILWKDFPEPIDPLGPENEIIISTGPWTATAAPQAGRAMLGCIDTKTGGFGSGSFGWFFPSILKYSGVDVLIIRGKAQKPTYVFIDNGKVVFKDASHIWGKETGETVRMIRKELEEHYDGEIRVLSTSVAGEHLVKYSPPCSDGTSCPGRSGAGAVMGSKNLKAIAVRGTGEISLYDPSGLLESSSRAVKTFIEKEPMIKLWREQGATTSLGTAMDWPISGAMLVENRQEADFPHLKNVGCLNCPNPCYHWLQIKDGKYSGLRHLGGHMTFLTVCLRNLGIQDFSEWIYYERLMQELGLDPASFSMAYSWAVDCFERGILTLDDTDGITLKRGDSEIICEVARKIAYREGKLGNLLADGVAEASQKIGKGSEAIAPHVKGKEYIQRDVKIQALMWSLGALTSPRGGDWLRHHNVWELVFLPEKKDTYPKFIGKTCVEVYQESLKLLDMPDELKKNIFGDSQKMDMEWIRDTKGKALFSVWTENLVALFNSLVTCMFGSATMFLMVGFGPTTYSEILNKITGWNTTYEELMKVGDRVFNLQRLFNYRLKGWDYRNDTFGDKRAYEPAQIGIFKGKVVPWDEVLKEYYSIRGWSERGLPTKEKLRELQIEDLANGLEL
ncbi:MAG: aldehyde ferredoxin oxidoreductase C-terminal domain-containing protein [Thermodesulfobacteriota bacterium]